VSFDITQHDRREVMDADFSDYFTAIRMVFYYVAFYET